MAVEETERVTKLLPPVPAIGAMTDLRVVDAGTTVLLALLRLFIARIANGNSEDDFCFLNILMGSESLSESTCSFCLEMDAELLKALFFCCIAIFSVLPTASEAGGGEGSTFWTGNGAAIGVGVDAGFTLIAVAAVVVLDAVSAWREGEGDRGRITPESDLLYLEINPFTSGTGAARGGGGGRGRGEGVEGRSDEDLLRVLRSGLLCILPFGDAAVEGVDGTKGD